jgi:hypothetical protein
VFERITAQFNRLRHKADWRAISDGGMPWLEHDAVIMGQSGGSGSSRPRVQTYDVYVRGQLVASRPGLGQAQAYVHEHHGEQTWQKGRSEPVTVEHRYFGETDEFGAPSTYWFADFA